MRLNELRVHLTTALSEALPPQPFYVSEQTYEKARAGSTDFPRPFLIWNGLQMRLLERLRENDPCIYYYDLATGNLRPVSDFDPNSKSIEATA